MKKFNSRTVVAIYMILLGIVWVFLGLTAYEWYHDGKPGSGFFPTIVGGLLILISILALISESKIEMPVFEKYHLHPIFTAVLVVLFSIVAGFFPALVLYVFGWLKWYEKYSLKTSLITTTVIIAVMYGVFALWLRVPFPAGMLVEAVLG